MFSCVNILNSITVNSLVIYLFIQCYLYTVPFLPHLNQYLKITRFLIETRVFSLSLIFRDLAAKKFITTKINNIYKLVVLRTRYISNRKTRYKVLEIVFFIFFSRLFSVSSLTSVSCDCIIEVSLILRTFIITK